MRKVWNNRKQVEAAAYYQLARQLKITPELAMICLKREYCDLENYLYYPWKYLHDPTTMQDLLLGVDVIIKHIKSHSKVVIFNDYDGDGITSGLIASQMLSEFGLEHIIITPHRIKEGYGMNNRMVQEAISYGANLVITTDNGIVAFEEVQNLRDAGIDVIITDHHECLFDDAGKMILPNANAVINPHRNDCLYPYKEICGANVIFKVAQVVLSYDNILNYGVNRTCENINEHIQRILNRMIELVGLATITDVMPLINENRYMVITAISLMKNTSYVGIRALLSVMQRDLSKINSSTFGFAIGPCLNSESRMTGVCSNAIQLFCETNYDKALEIAQDLVRCNNERKNEVYKAEQEVLQNVINSDDKVIFYKVDNFKHTLCGILAGNIVEVTGKPCFICSKNEDDLLVGSGRSRDGYDVISAFRQQKDSFLKLGGHKLALGGCLLEENFESLREKINNQAIELPPPDVLVDIYIDMCDVRPELVSELDMLEPFGECNQEPVFVAENVRLYKMAYLGKNKEYRRFYFVDSKGRKSEAVCFCNVDNIEKMLIESYGKQVVSFLIGGVANCSINVMYYPVYNTWNGRTSIQFQVKDIQVVEA